MAKKKKGPAGLKQTSKVAMNKLKRSQNIVIMLMILFLIVGMCLMVFFYMYDDLNRNSGQTAEQGQAFPVDVLFGSAPVDISIETTAKTPPKFFIISAYNFQEISPDRSVPNEYTDPQTVQQIEQASVHQQYGKKDFRFEGDLDNNEWYVLVVTNQTEGGITFNMIYEISVYSFRPLALPLIFPIILILEVVCFLYILVINSKLKKVQEKISTQRLLKAQMNMVRNFILQSSGSASQPFGFSSSPYKSDSGEAVPRDGIPLAVATKQMEIVECYGCNELITINTPERPLIVACPNCGVKSQVVDEREEAEEEAPTVSTEPTLPPAEPEMKLLPSGSPSPEEGAAPAPSPVPTPAPIPNPTPQPEESQE